LMLSLDTLSLKSFWPSSNVSIGYMVENLILRPFERHMTLSLTP
jgi:hypothetical protein